MPLWRDKSRKMKLEKIDSTVESMLDSVEEEEELNLVGKTGTRTVKVKLQFKKRSQADRESVEFLQKHTKRSKDSKQKIKSFKENLGKCRRKSIG